MAILAVCEINVTHQSFIKIVQCKDGKPIILLDQNITSKIDLFNLDIHSIRIKYCNEEVLIYIDTYTEPLVKCVLPLRKINEKGDSFTGILNFSQNMQSVTEVNSWTFVHS